MLNRDAFTPFAQATAPQQAAESPLTISVVTPSYQQADYIEQTIRSVVDQDYAPVEYFIMDGGSNDGTVEILRRYEHRLQWQSEPDHGQADAINKGFALATGDIFGWLNSDDAYTPGALRQVAAYFTEHPEADFVYGDAIGIDGSGHEYGVRLHVALRQSLPASDVEILVHRYDFLVQPACFWRASLWRAVGELDTSLRYVMDYDYWMRAAQRVPLHYLPVPLAYERLHAAAKTTTGGLPRLDEIERVAQRYGGQGLPENYRAEAAAYYTAVGLQSLIRGHLAATREYWRHVSPPRDRLQTYLRFLSILLLFGPRGIPTAWLWLNRLRLKFGGHPSPRSPSADESAPT